MPATTTDTPLPVTGLPAGALGCADCCSRLSNPIVMVDPDGQIIYGNAAFGQLALARVGPQASPASLEAVLPGLPAQMELLDAVDAEGEFTTHLRELHLTTDGGALDLLAYLTPIHDDGAHRGWMIQLCDISHVRQAERTSRHSLEIEMFLSRVSSRFVGSREPGAAFGDAMTDLGEFTRASRAFLLLLDPRGHGFDAVHEWHPPGQASLAGAFTAHGPLLRDRLTRLLASQEIVEIEDLTDLDPDVRATVIDAGGELTGSLILVPLVVNEELGGVIGLRHHASEEENLGLWVVLDVFCHIVERVVLLDRRDAALQESSRQLAEKQAQLVHSEKMATIGQISAGVAHELNNPIGFVMSNLGTLAEYAGTIKHALGACQAVLAADADASGALPADAAAQLSALDPGDLDFVIEDLDDLIDESLEGCVRVRDIVQNLKGFARADETAPRPVDLNGCVTSTLKIVWNELKYTCEVATEFGDLPPVTCLPGPINQVIMNLLLNAGQAIAQQGTITVRTGHDPRAASAWIAVADDGGGIAPDRLTRIFDPFYTTKEPGKGTGLGLYICHTIIEEHGGRIDVASTEGEGTTFTVTLPIDGPGTDVAVPHD